MTSVSAVVTSYNQKEFIFESIDSLIDQVDELIVIDDFSTDDSLGEIIESYSTRKNFKIFRNSQNMGVAASFMRGYELCSSEYILLQAGDDVSLDNRRLNQEKILNEHQNVLLSFSKPIIIDESGKLLPNSFAENSFNNPLGITNYTKDLFSKGNSICAPSAAFRKKELLKVGGFMSNFDHMQDYLAWLFLSMEGDFHFSELPVVKFRVHGNNMSRNIEDPLDPIVKSRKIEFAVAINLFIDSLSLEQTRLLFEKLEFSYLPEFSLELNKIQLKRSYPNSALLMFVLNDCYKLSSESSNAQYKVLRQLIKQLPSQVII